MENMRQFKCRHCGWSLWKSLASRPLERKEIKELLENKKVGPLEGFRSRFGKTFSATLLLDEALKTKFSFQEESQEEAEELLRKAEAITACPLCKEGRIREGMNSYLCDRSIGSTKNANFGWERPFCSNLLLESR